MLTGQINQITATEAKAKLAELLRAVERGEQFEITRNGRPVALVQPPAPSKSLQEQKQEAFESFLEERKKWTIPGGMTTEEILAW